MNEYDEYMYSIEHYNLKDLITDVSKNYNGSLYHYTSAEGLLGILKNKTLRFTNSDYLNDKSEGNYIKTLLDKILEDSKYEDISKEIRNVVMKNSILPDDSPNTDIDLKIINAAGQVKRRNQYFVCCFSEDDDSLNMWSNYTKEGNSGGYCISFDYNILYENIIKIKKENDSREESALKNHLKIYAFKVIYNKEKQCEIIRTILDNYIKNKKSEGINIQVELNDVARCFQIIGFIFKHQAFSAEKEIRLVYEIPFFHNYFSFDAVEFISKNGVIKPYIDLSYTQDNYSLKNVTPTVDDPEPKKTTFEKCPIKGIKLSPTLPEDISKKSVAWLLQKYEFDCLVDEKITVSDIPYRNI